MISKKIQNKLKIAGITLSLLFSFVLLSTVSAEAQWRDGRRNDRRWGSTNKRAVENLIRRVEQRTDVFVRQFDRALDNSRTDGTLREDRLNELARQLETSTDELRREFDRGDSLAENRDEVQRVMNIASRIDQAVRRSRGNSAARNTWRNLRVELNALARVYNVRAV